MNHQQNDGRLSAVDYRAVRSAETASTAFAFSATFDVTNTPTPRLMFTVMQNRPELFSDLSQNPADLAIWPGFTFKP